MKYEKIKDGKGDFNNFSAVELHHQLLAELGPQEERWYLDTSELSIRLVVNDATLDLSGVDKIMKDHFKIDWSDYDPVKDKKDKLKSKLSGATTIVQLRQFIEEELI